MQDSTPPALSAKVPQFSARRVIIYPHDAVGLDANLVRACECGSGLGEKLSMGYEALWGIIPLAAGVGAIWVYYDAMEHTDAACAWGCLATLLPIPVVPFYFIMRLYSSRPASKKQLARFATERKMFDGPRFASDIEKMKYIEAAESGPGTMYDPYSEFAQHPGGYRHFSDQRADALLQQMRFAEAWDYLIDLYALAQQDHDVRGQDTYRHYLACLPNGLKQLDQWQQQQERAPDDPQPKPKRRREVPF